MVDNTDSYEKQEALKDKASTIGSIKSVAITQGGKPLTTQNIVLLLDSVTTTLTNRINHLTMNTTRQFLPVVSTIKQVEELLTSRSEEDVDKGFELIDKLQKRLGTDLSKYSKEMGEAIKKLYDMNQQQKDDKAEKERERTKKTEELTQERDILRERGINTFVNAKDGKLEIKTKREERAELKKIQQEERDIEKDKKIAASELKDFQNEKRKDTITEEKILKDQKQITAREENLQRDKDRMGLKPKDRVSGALDQTVGEAFRQIKTFGKEIAQLGGDIFNGVKKSFGFVTSTVSGFGRGFKKVGGDLMSGFGKLASATKGLIVGFIGMFIAMIKFILIALVVGVVIYAVFKVIMFVIDIIKGVIDFFKESFEKLMDIWPFSLISDDEGDKKGEEAKAKAASYEDSDAGTAGDIRGETYMAGEGGRTGEFQGPLSKEEERARGDRRKGESQSRQEARHRREDTEEYIAKIKKMSPEEREAKGIKYSEVSPKELNKLSQENMASYKSAGNNTVIAPNISNSSVSGSKTSVMSLDPTNNDRSFINLNSNVF